MNSLMVKIVVAACRVVLNPHHFMVVESAIWHL